MLGFCRKGEIVKMKQENKKGDIPVTILVIGVLGVCTLALLSFVLVSAKVSDSFKGIGLMEKANIQIETGNLNQYSDEINETKIVPNLSFNWTRKVVVFSVNYIKPSTG